MKKAKQNRNPLPWKSIALASACAFITCSANASLVVNLDLDYDGDAEELTLTWVSMSVGSDDIAYQSDISDGIAYSGVAGYAFDDQGTGGIYGTIDYYATVVSGLSDASTTLNNAGVAADEVTPILTNGGYFVGGQGNFLCSYDNAGSGYSIVVSGVDSTEYNSIVAAYNSAADNSAGSLTVTPIPEPATFALLGLFGGALFAVRRFNKG